MKKKRNEWQAALIFDGNLVSRHLRANINTCYLLPDFHLKKEDMILALIATQNFTAVGIKTHLALTENAFKVLPKTKCHKQIIFIKNQANLYHSKCTVHILIWRVIAMQEKERL